MADPAESFERTLPAEPAAGGEDSAAWQRTLLAAELDLANTLFDPQLARTAAAPQTPAPAQATLASEQLTLKTPGAADTLAPGEAAQADREPAEVATSIRPGASLGHFLLEERVGAGGEGVVWRARDTILGKPVALKLLPQKLAADQNSMRRMREEATVLLELTHEHIVRLHTIQSAGGVAFLVMEFLEGSTLDAAVERRRAQGARGLDADEAVWVLEQVAPALDYANAKGVTHRDIKPSNLLLTAPLAGRLGEGEARVKLTDFGVAFVTSAQLNALTGYVPVGTLPFMAPEVLRREQPTPAADIYSLGATLYCLVAGEPPLLGSGLVQRILEQPAPPLASGDEHLDAAVAAALDKDPAARPRSADELLSLASGGRHGRAAAEARARRARRRALAIAALVVALGAPAPWIVNRIRGALMRVEMDIDNGELPHNGETVWVRGSVRSWDESPLAIAWDGGEPLQLDVGSDGEFEQKLPLPAADGVHTLRVIDAAGAARAERTLIVDRTEPTCTSVQPSGVGPFAAEDDLQVEVGFDEPVVPLAADGQPLSEEIGTGLHVLRLRLPADLGTEPRRLQVYFAARDRAGNASKSQVVEVDAFSRAAVLREHELAFERLPRQFDAFTLDAVRGKLLGFRDAVEKDRLLRPEDREMLLGPEWEALIGPVEREWDARPKIAVELDGLSADGVLRTRVNPFVLSGRVEGARTEDLRIAVLDPEPPREEITAYDLALNAAFEFSRSIHVPTNRRSELRLTGAGLDLGWSADLIHDDVAPVLSLPGAASPLRTRESSLPLGVETSEELSALRLDGEALPRPAGQGSVWSATIDCAAEGERTLVFSAIDLAGNPGSLPVLLQVDRSPPAPLRFEPFDGTVLDSLAELSLRLEFDEPLAGAAISIAFEPQAGGDRELSAPPVTLDGTVLTCAFRPPDKAGSLSVSWMVRDDLRNASEGERLYDLRLDPWGSFPTALRAGFEIAGEDSVPDGERRLPKAIRHVRTGLELVYVRGGELELGSPAGEAGRDPGLEGPARRVSMTGFYIGRTEVSRVQYERGGGPPPGGSAAGDLPVEVERPDAALWCSALGFALPTEAQWEWAASGPEQRVYPWAGAFDPQRANGGSGLSSALHLGAPVAVDAFPAGAAWCAAVQMAGNVSEWCADWWPSGYPAGAEGATDPLGDAPAGAVVGVERGGGYWAQTQDKLRTASRNVQAAEFVAKTAGFRPIRSL